MKSKLTLFKKWKILFVLFAILYSENISAQLNNCNIALTSNLIYEAVARDSDGNFYVPRLNQLLIFNSAGVQTASYPISCNSMDVEIDVNDMICIGCSGIGQDVKCYDPSDGSLAYSYVPPPPASNVHSLGFGPNDDLYISDWSGRRIHKYNSAGVFQWTYQGPSTYGNFWDVDEDSNGKIWVVTANSYIIELDGSGSFVQATQYPGFGSFSNVLIDGADQMWVTGISANSIYEFSTTSPPVLQSTESSVCSGGSLYGTSLNGNEFVAACIGNSVVSCEGIVPTDPCDTDTTPPDPVCDQNSTTTLDANCERWISASQLDSDSDDNCTAYEDLRFSYSPTDVNDTEKLFDFDDLGINQVSIWVWDEADNVSEECFAQLNVIDNTAPECMTMDITVDLDAAGNASIVPSDVDDGTADACQGPVTLSVSPNSFSCSDIGDNTVTLTAIDESGNESTCTANVHIDDVTPPVAICQDFTVQLDAAGNASITAADIDNGSNDECGVTLSASPTSFECSNVGANTVTLTVADPDGNTSTCTATVTVEDNVPPVAVCQDITIQLDAGGNISIADADIDGGSTDACLPLTFSASQTDFTCSDIGDNSVVLTVTDANNNEAMCTATVTVEDNVPPVAVCQDITVQLDANGEVVVGATEIDGGSSDNCTTYTAHFEECVGFIEESAPVGNFGSEAFNIGTYTFDGVNPLSLSITVASPSGTYPAVLGYPVGTYDPLNPHLNWTIGYYLVGPPNGPLPPDPANGTYNLTFNPPAGDYEFAVLSYDPDGNPNWDGTYTVNSFDDNFLDCENLYGCDDLGPNVVTLIIADDNGNSSTCEATITVEDNIPPTMNCMDFDVILDAAGNGTITPSMADGGSSDNCDITLSVGPTSVVCAGPDFSGFTLVGDHNGHRYYLSNDVFTWPDAAADAALHGGNIAVINDAAENTFVDGGAADWTWLGGTDELNEGTWVWMNGEPMTYTNWNGGEPNDAGSGEDYMQTWFGDTWNDNNNVPQWQYMLEVAAFGENEVPVVLMGVDGSGNTASCLSVATLVDITPPVAVCQDVTIQLDVDGNASITGADVDGGSTDACGIESITPAQTAFTCDDVGTNAIVVTVEDVNGNQATCTANVTVEDNIDPECMAKDITVVLGAAFGGYTLNAIEIDDGSTDACEPLTYEVQRYFGAVPGGFGATTFFSCSDVGGNTVDLRVTDANGNSSICSATVTVEDNTSPFLNCQDNIVVSLNSDGQGALIAINLMAWWGIYDACGIDELLVDGEPIQIYDCSDLGFFDVLVSATDVNGNTTECTVEIEVRDQEDPDCETMDITVYLDANGEASIDSNDVDNGSSDNCTIVSITLDDQDFTCADVDNPVTVTQTVEDQSGNTSQCTAVVTVLDTIDPTCLTLDITVQLDADGLASIDSNAVDNGSMDACGVESIELDIQNFDCEDVGSPVTVTQTVTDVNGNTSECTATVTVEDNVAPEALCQNAVVELDASGQGTLDPADLDNGSNDACGLIPLTVSQTSFDCSHVGINIITLTVEDVNGNISTCEDTVMVVDNTIPVALCQDVTIELDENGNAMLTPGMVDNGSFDECGIADICIGKGVETSSLGGTLDLSDPIFVYDNSDPAQSCIDDPAIFNGCCNIIDGVHHYDQAAFTISQSDTYTFTLTDINGVTDFLGIIYDSSFNPLDICDNIIYGDDDSAGGLDPQIVITLTMAPGDYILITSTWGDGDDDFPAPYEWDVTSVAGGTINAFECAQTLDYTCLEVGDNTVTLCATDVNGNVAYCSSTVTVEDNIAPTMNCMDFEVDLDEFGSATITSAMVDGGSSDACGIASLTVGPEEVGCDPTDFSEFTYLGDYNGHSYYKSNNQFDFYDAIDDATEHGGMLATISDAAENALAASGGGSCWIGFNDIRVEGDFVWHSGEAISYDNWLGGEPNNLGNEDATIINFGGTGLWNDVPINLTYMYILEVAMVEAGEVSVVLHAEDENGNTASCLSVATVNDVTAPDAVCANIDVYLDAAGLASIDGIDVDAGSSDACGIDTMYVDIANFDCDDVAAPVDVVLSVVDHTGNIGTCGAVVTVIDTIDPVAVCLDITVDLDFNGQVTITGAMIDGGSTDACGIASLDAGEGVENLDCSNVGDNTITLTVTDVNGNESQCDATVTVEDNVAPLVNCVNNVEVPLNSDGIGFVTKEEVTGATFDACGIVDTFIIRNDDPSHPDYGIENEMLFFDCSDIGFVDVIIRVYDANGNVEECNTAVNVKDEIAPTMECLGITVYLDVNGEVSIDSNALDNGSYDNCSIVEFSVDNSDFTCADVGMNLVTMTAEDQSGNTSSCSGPVMVMDTIKPVAMCMDITVQLNSDGMVTLDSNAVENGSMDACGIAEVSVSPNSFTCADVGTNTVTMTVEDENGNTSTCTATVTVEDNVDPDVECVATTVNLELSDVNGTNATVTPGELLSESVVIKGSNSGGGGASTDYTVAISAPTVLDFFWFYTSNNSSPVYDNFGYTINGVYTQLSDDGGALQQDGTESIVLNPGDVFGLRVNATDNIFGRAKGSITGFELTGDFDPANWTLTNSAGADGSAYTNSTGSGATDACGIASITIDNASWDCSQLGDHTVTVTVEDVNGNTNTCDATVTVQDVDAPIAVCSDITIQLDAAGVASIDSNAVDGGSFDGCTVVMVDIDNKDFDCDDVGANTVTMTVEDQSGNESTCTATVTVEDNVDPTAVCKNIDVVLDDSGNASITGAMIDDGSDDACGVASLVASPNAFTCANLGDNTVTLTVTDNNGNVSQCTATVTVSDETAPTCSTMDITVQLDSDGNASIVPGDVNDGSSDACGITSMSVSPNSFTCAEAGDNTVTLTLVDGSGNTSDCTATVTVEDNVAPTAVCQNITVQLDADGVASIDSSAVDGGSTDACGIESFATDITSFDCSNLGDNTVTLTVYDIHGNESNCTATVTVEDNEGPIFTCPDDITINTIPSDCNQNVFFPELMPVDACTGTDVTWEYSALDIVMIPSGDTYFALLPVGLTEVTATAWDDFGNSTTCTFNVEVFDNIDPVILGCDVVGDISTTSDGSICGAVVSWDETLITANDNCSGQGGGVIISSDWEPGDTFPEGTTTVTYTATDDAGNTATCTFDVTVVPNTPMADFTYIDASLAVIFTNASTNSTNWDWDFGDSNTSTDENPTHNYAAGGTYTVCLTASDDCGNEDTYCEDITLVDSGNLCVDVNSMETGWNLISFDVAPADSTIAAVFGAALGVEVDYISSYDNGALIYDPAAPLPFLNTLQHITRGFGYWVHCVADVSITNTGECLDEDYKKDLDAGWNLVSYIPQAPQPPALYFEDLEATGNLQFVTTFSPSTGSLIYDPSAPLPFLNTLQFMENGWGYWVKVDVAVGGGAWAKEAPESESRSENTDAWGNPKTIQFDFINGKVAGLNDGERIDVLNENGDLVIQLEVIHGEYLMTTPIYGDDTDTPDEKDGMIKGEVLSFEYDGIVSEVTVVFDGNKVIHFVDLDFEKSTVSVQELGEDNITIYPNPFFSQATIQIDVVESSNYDVKIMDAAGKLAVSKPLGRLNAGTHNVQIDREGLQAGQYIIIVSNLDKKSFTKLPVIVIE